MQILWLTAFIMRPDGLYIYFDLRESSSVSSQRDSDTRLGICCHNGVTVIIGPLTRAAVAEHSLGLQTLNVLPLLRCDLPVVVAIMMLKIALGCLIVACLLGLIAGDIINTVGKCHRVYLISIFIIIHFILLISQFIILQTFQCSVFYKFIVNDYIKILIKKECAVRIRLPVKPRGNTRYIRTKAKSLLILNL